MNRRQYLAVVSTSVVTAGCLGWSGDSGATKLGTVSLYNHDEEPHNAELQVFWDGDRVHDSTHTISADERGDRRLPGAVPEQTWPDRAGQFRLRARLTDGEWHEIDPADDDYPDCYGVLIDIDSDGRLAIFTSTNPRECADERVSQEANESTQSDSAQLAD